MFEYYRKYESDYKLVGIFRISLACVRMNFRFDQRSLGLFFFCFIWSIGRKNGNNSNSSFCVWE